MNSALRPELGSHPERLLRPLLHGNSYCEAWSSPALETKESMIMSKKNVALATATLTTLFSSSAFAQDAAGGVGAGAQAAAAIGAGIAIGLAVLGGTLGQGRAAAAALEGISRNPGAAPRIQTPMILGLALMESLVLFAFAIAFLLQSKIV